MTTFISCLLTVVLAAAASAHPADSATTPRAPQGATYEVIVYDAEQHVELELARVSLYRGATFVAGKVTSTVGSAVFRDIVPGTYERRITHAGYVGLKDTVTITSSTVDTVLLRELVSGEVVVQASKEPPVTSFDPITGNQVFESEAYHPAPTARMTQLVQQNMLGAVRAPTGEVHVRGQHGEFTYYVDGAPVPLGVFGGLNEVVDPAVIARAVFWNGGWPAEYGGQMAAIIDVQNRVPGGRFHLDVSSYAGSYMPNGGKDTLVNPNRALNSNGQEFSLSQGFGKVGFFLSGSRQETDRRVDPPTPTIFHDHGFDYFLYGKTDYILSDKEYLTMNLNYGRTLTQVPFDSVEEGALDDHQQTTNAFQTLTYYRTLSDSADRESNLLIAGYAREGSLQFMPSTSDPGSIQLYANDSTQFIVGEDRTFTTLGIRSRYEQRLSHAVQLVAGGSASTTRGTEHFTFDWPNDGIVGPRVLIPSSTTNYAGSDFGVFAQTELHPVEWSRFDLGLRYDQHIAPDIPFTSQWSPRVKWSLDVMEGTTAYLYYGRLFMPNNIEGLRSLASRVDTTPALGTMPERDDFYEAMLEQTFDIGLRVKAAYFAKESVPGVDDETVGSSAVKTPVNIQHVHTKGIDLGLSYSPSESPFSAYVNTSLIHAYRSGVVTGGFLALDAGSGGISDLDHDQRLSVVASVNYQPTDWFVNLTATYGSGLINSNADAVFRPGLFDFNTSGHTTPSWILNVSAGHKIYWQGMELEPSLFVTNLLDHHHLLKGAYFSGASWEEPRNVVVKLALHL